MSIQSVQNSSVNPLAANVNNKNEKMTDSLGKEYKFADVTAESLKKKQAEEEAKKALIYVIIHNLELSLF